MALWLIGLGLHDANDISVKGLEAAQSCETVYAEFYTAMLAGTSLSGLEAALGLEVRELERHQVEEGALELILEAKKSDIALLVAGDPMTATTHTDLVVRCRANGVAVRIIHAASIFSAAPGLLGLQHYKFGRTTTLVRPEPDWNPTSPFDAVASNHNDGLHTLALLDIKAHENPPYFMTANEGLKILQSLAEQTGNEWFNSDSQVGVVGRAGSLDPTVLTGAMSEMVGQDFGQPLHCIVIPAAMQVVEQEAWDSLQVS